MSSKAWIVGLALVLVGLPLAAPTARAAGPTVSVLVDFGDGTYLWANVTLPATNVTAIKATELANASWSLPPFNVTWYDSPFCVRRPCAFVSDIGNRTPAYPVWWHFYLWNATAKAWDVASHGPSDTDLGNGAVIAWYLAVDDPVTYASPRPVETPDFRDVWASFRADLANSGRAHGTIPATNHLLWDHDVGVREIDTTPVVAYGYVYVATRSALVALDAATGAEVWRNPHVHDLLSTPSVYDGHLVLGGTDGRLHYVNALNGTEDWSVLLEPEAKSTGIASSPSVYMDRAYIGTFNESVGGRGRLAAVNLNNGTVAWALDTPGVIHMSKPLIVKGPSGMLAFVGVMGVYDGSVGYSPPYGLFGADLDGSSSTQEFYANDSVASSPVLAPDRGGCSIFLVAKDGHLYDYDVCRDRTARLTLEGPGVGSPAVFGGLVIVGTGGAGGGGNLSAVSTVGPPETKWSVSVGGGVEASPTSDGRLVCAATNVADGSYVCVRVSDGGIAWTYTPSPHDYILGSPVVVRDTLYAPSDNGHVYAFRDATSAPPTELPTSLIVGGILIAATIAILTAGLLWRRRRRSDGA